MKWDFIPGTQNVTPLSVAGDYVISHRPEQFTVSFRPSGKHLALGTYRTLKQAQKTAEKHQTESEVQS